MPSTCPPAAAKARIAGMTGEWAAIAPQRKVVAVGEAAGQHHEGRCPAAAPSPDATAWRGAFRWRGAGRWRRRARGWCRGRRRWRISRRLLPSRSPAPSSMSRLRRAPNPGRPLPFSLQSQEVRHGHPVRPEHAAAWRRGRARTMAAPAIAALACRGRGHAAVGWPRLRQPCQKTAMRRLTRWWPNRARCRALRNPAAGRVQGREGEGRPRPSRRPNGSCRRWSWTSALGRLGSGGNAVPRGPGLQAGDPAAAGRVRPGQPVPRRREHLRAVRLGGDGQWPARRDDSVRVRSSHRLLDDGGEPGLRRDRDVLLREWRPGGGSIPERVAHAAAARQHSGPGHPANRAAPREGRPPPPPVRPAPHPAGR